NERNGGYGWTRRFRRKRNRSHGVRPQGGCQGRRRTPIRRERIGPHGVRPQGRCQGRHPTPPTPSIKMAGVGLVRTTAGEFCREKKNGGYGWTRRFRRKRNRSHGVRPRGGC